jgi:hypothetical protein
MCNQMCNEPNSSRIRDSRIRLFSLFTRLFTLRPRRDSNSRSRLRRAVLYPLSYGGYSIDILLAR